MSQRFVVPERFRAALRLRRFDPTGIGRNLSHCFASHVNYICGASAGPTPPMSAYWLTAARANKTMMTPIDNMVRTQLMIPR